MTDLEARLRAELPELADRLLDHHGGGLDGERPTLPPFLDPRAPELEELPPIDGVGGPGWRGDRRLLAAAAAIVVVGAIAVVAAAAGRQDTTATIAEPSTSTPLTTGSTAEPSPGESTPPAIDAPSAPSGFGRWRELADAPIERRSHPVVAWTGSELLVWAGSSLDRSFAYTGGAAYDPGSDSWRSLPGPGWGHPMISAAYLDGVLYLLAKGGGEGFDVDTGASHELAATDGLALEAVVTVGPDLWGIGAAWSEVTQESDLAIARYDRERDQWEAGAVLAEADPATVSESLELGQQPLWTGEEIVVWSTDGPSPAYDPAASSWRMIDVPLPETGLVSASRAAVTADGLTALVDVESGVGPHTRLAVLTDAGWEWRQLIIPEPVAAEATVVGAGEWLVVLRPGGGPLTIHVPTGAWASHDHGPLGGVAGAGAVWTDAEVLIWGGQADEGVSPQGLAWTPPAAPPPAAAPAQDDLSQPEG